MESAIAPDRHSASAELVDSSSVLVAKVSWPRRRNPMEFTTRTTSPVPDTSLSLWALSFRVHSGRYSGYAIP